MARRYQGAPLGVRELAPARPRPHLGLMLRGGCAILMLLLFGCGAPTTRGVDTETRLAYRAVLTPRADCRLPSAESLTPAQMQRDWDRIELVLRRGYAGFEQAGDEAEWAAALAEGRRTTEAAIGDDGTLDVESFRNTAVEHLRFANDNHLALTLRRRGGNDWRSTSAHQQAHRVDLTLDVEGRDPDGRQLLACAGQARQDVLRPVLGVAAEVIWSPILLSEVALETVSCTFESETGPVEVEAAASRVSIRDRGRPYFAAHGHEEALWLRVRTLVASRSGALDEFAASAGAANRAPATVLDLRSIGGGADRFLNQWFGGYSDRPIQYWNTRRIKSEVALQGALNFWGCVAASSSGDAGGRAWVEARVQRAERELANAMHTRGIYRELIDGEYTVQARADAAPRGPLILLVDRGCASACETSVVLARQIPGALVVGENTEGTMRVGEIRSYRLPESGIVLTAGTRIHEDPTTGTFPEGRGWLPDLWLTDDVERATLDLAACLTEPSCEARVRSAVAR
ncbi:MAG: S41 family peptidase [Sandaracinaceae bacterium]